MATAFALIATAGSLAAAPTAGAVTFESLSTTPSSTQAGGHPDFTLSARFGDTTNRVRGLRIDLPAGLVGNPNAVTKCPVATFQSGGCGGDSAVGSTTVKVRARIKLPLLDWIWLPVDAPGTVYNLEPVPGEPARLGIEVVPVGGILGVIRLQSPIAVRDGSDYGLTATIDELPQSLGIADTEITGLDLTLRGVNGAPFLTLPTSCAAATTSVTATSYDGGGATSASASFTPTGCADVPLAPSINVVPETGRVDSPSGMEITLGVPGDESPVRQSHVRTAEVVLPEGVALNPGAAAGLEACAESAFGRGSRSDPGCPAASAIGTVSFTSPPVGTLSGTVYQGEPLPGKPVRLYVDVPGPGLRIKLIGDVALDPATGRVTTTFTDLPQLPFTAFTLRFRGGDRAILTTPPTCGVAVSRASLEAYSGNGFAPASSTFTVSADGAGAPCPDPAPFAPRLAVGANPPTAGAQTALTTTITRDDGSARLGGMALSFPPGLLGGLGGGIGLCGLDAARAATCPPESRVGSVNVLAGPGGAPLRLGGDVFLTAPIDGGLAGLAITVPAKVGPLDLGTAVTLARIAVRPGDAGLEVQVPELPQIQGGIPLSLRQMELVLDRPGFMRNATSCAPGEIAATLTAVGGRTAQASAPYRSTGCGDVPFAPKVSGSAGAAGERGRGDHPPLTVAIEQGAGELSARRVAVQLPKQLAIDFLRVGKACPAGEDCGDRARVGTATAVTPLLPIPLTGPVNLVVPEGGGLPGLEVRLEGLLALRLKGTAAFSDKGVVTTTFDGIPDVPLSRFELQLDGGARGILKANERLCASPLRAAGSFVAQDGTEAQAAGRLAVPGCKANAASKAKGKKPKGKKKGAKGKGKGKGKKGKKAKGKKDKKKGAKGKRGKRRA